MRRLPEGIPRLTFLSALAFYAARLIVGVLSIGVVFGLAALLARFANVPWW